MPTLRVGVYCRQSVASDLAFGSIQAQRESVEAYAKSQGWMALPDEYSDGGFSGSNTERPGYQRMLADVAAGRVDVVGVYRIDRVSRSLSDFTHFVELLDKHGVGFVSVTQSFDTRTSMGRLTLNILASFSQFESETIAERTRDKIAATRRKGMFTGGRPVIGFDIRDKQLIVNAAEAETVKAIFATYLEHGGLVSTVAELERRGITNKSWTNKSGKHVRGATFDKGSLRGLLTNPIYIGKIRCGDELVEGKHEAIVDAPTFAAVAAALRDRRRPYRQQVGKWNALLVGILRCGRCGAAMTHAVNVRGERAHRYYACTTMQKQGATACPGSRAPAGELEGVVISRIKAIGADPSVVIATLTAAAQTKRAQEPELIAEARRVATESTTIDGQRRNLLDALQHGGVAANTIAARIAELDDQIGQLQLRNDEVNTQLAAMQNDTVDEDAIRAALADFTATWDHLVPRERARVLRLLIEEVLYDGQAGEVTISFRDTGIRALGREAATRMPA